MLLEDQKDMSHEYKSACWLHEEIEKYRLSIGFINGNCIDKWANSDEAGCVYTQTENGKDYNYVAKIMKRDTLVDFIITKGLSDSEIFGEPVTRMSPNNTYTSQIMSYLQQCAKSIDMTEIHKYIKHPVQLLLFN
jgi:hypothetical protein